MKVERWEIIEGWTNAKGQNKPTMRWNKVSGERKEERHVHVSEKVDLCHCGSGDLTALRCRLSELAQCRSTTKI